jgi:hypothetical protein
MLYVFDDKVLKPKSVPNRIPSAQHWGVYRRVEREAPDLLRAMYVTISEIVTSEQYMNPDGRFPNSSWIGSKVLPTWPRISQWNAVCGDEVASSALFGEIMWTVMYDDDRPWCTTKTTHAGADREERVYWILKDWPQ